MGKCQSKNPAFDEESVYDELERSFHSVSKSGTQRQQLAKHHDGVDITEIYDIVQVIGQGSMGEVTIVQKKQKSLSVHGGSSYHGSSSSLKSFGKAEEEKPTQRGTQRRFACKTVNTTRMKPSELAEFFNEITILRDLDHPNIIQLFEVFKVKRKVWMVMELCSGGDISSRANEMTEETVAEALEQILRAVYYMHKRNVCHRDIKMENIMYSTKAKDSDVKLIDFGLSNKFRKGQKMKAACGTIYTMCPELLSGDGYTELSDVWSIGVIAWILLSQTYPFLTHAQDLRDEAKVNKLKNATLEFGPAWKERGVSKYGMEFCANCLKASPSDRWFSTEALGFVQNYWIPYLEEHAGGGDSKPCESSASSVNKPVAVSSDNDVSPAFRRTVSAAKRRATLDYSTIHGMQKFGSHGELKKTILMTMAYTMDKSSLGALRDMFAVLDKKSTGTIDLAELKQALQEMKFDDLSDDKIEKLFKGVDVDNSGEIHYNEFLAAVAESQGLITQERLAEAFDRIDSDGKGYISKQDLRNVLGSDCNDNLVNRMMDQADLKKDGRVDYDEFLKLMFEEDPVAGMEGVGSLSLENRASQENLAKLNGFQQLGAIGVVSTNSLKAGASFQSPNTSIPQSVPQ